MSGAIIETQHLDNWTFFSFYTNDFMSCGTTTMSSIRIQKASITMSETIFSKWMSLLTQ